MPGMSWIDQSYFTWSGRESVMIGTLVIVISLYLLRNAQHALHQWVYGPWTVAIQMRKLGYSGPPFTIFTDNSKEIQEMLAKAKSQPLLSISQDFYSRIFPHFHCWTKLYGKRFICSPVRGAILMQSADPQVVKEVFNNIGIFDKSLVDAFFTDLLGETGLVFSKNDEWAKQRRVLRPTFYASKSKEMVTKMASWTEPWLDRLEALVVQNGGLLEKDITEDIGELTKDILARSSFGSSFAQGRKAFEAQIELRDLVGQNAFTSRLLRYVPTSLNRKLWEARRKVANRLLDIIQTRRDSVKAAGSGFYGDDLLGVLLTQTENEKGTREKWTDKNLMDQCKTFFSAGSDTVLTVISWGIMLLAYYHDWQERIRVEMKKVFKDEFPDGRKLAQLKSLQMFVEETLRLYPPAPQINREVLQDNVSFLGQPVPKHLSVRIDVLALHRDTELWGEDALEFKPERFAQGVAKACKNVYGYVPFGAGPRSCVAQPLALTEVKLVLAMLVRRFSLRLAPSYRHEPVYHVNLMPKLGVQVILEPCT